MFHPKFIQFITFNIFNQNYYNLINYIDSNCSLLFNIGYNSSSNLNLNNAPVPAVKNIKQCHKE